MKYFYQKRLQFLLLPALLISLTTAQAQFYKPIPEKGIACSNNDARSWWDVLHYDLSVNLTDTLNGNIEGINVITARVVQYPNQLLQIDLDTPLDITTASIKGKNISFDRRGSAYFLVLSNQVFYSLSIGDTFNIIIHYKGRPVDAKNPPWDGGFVRKKDQSGRFWEAVACQGQGASLWFPCKNFQGDEPDSGVSEHYTVPNDLKAIGNGRLTGKKVDKEKQTTTYSWKVVNPINNYDITFYIGNYKHWQDTFHGLDGALSLNFYVLPKSYSKARKQFQEVKTMLRCFESHFGPYPFYKDGYKLVQAPYLGMEHQSAVAYGNHFKMGYLGRDRSGTGVGLLFDFIIVHESAHEWFGNSITAYDKADSWIHEGFASYAETVYAECIAGKQKAFAYQQGKRRTITNKIPVEGKFNQCDEGSPDAYDKAGFMIHMIRIIMNNDTVFFDMLKAINARYRHQIVTGKQLEDFISAYARKDFSKVFDQYLRTAALPVLIFNKSDNGAVRYQWTNCVPGFDMPVYWTDQKDKIHWLYPKTSPQLLNTTKLKNPKQISRNFLINVKWKQGN